MAKAAAEPASLVTVPGTGGPADRSGDSRPVIEVRHLTKRYGPVLAVDDLSFTVAAGQVTGFLGPNGSGKSTTMITWPGSPPPTRYRGLASMRFSASSAWRARPAAGPGELSLGMGQRLGIAAALLGDPAVLIFDEPVNGLDPEGILWVRKLLQSLAAEGRTVLVSSHLMSEMALTADHLIIIGRGRLLATGTVAEFIERSEGHHVHAQSPDADALAGLLRQQGATVTADGPEGLSITGLESRDVGITAAHAALTLYELTTQRASLEDAFMELTHEHGEYRAPTPVQAVD